MAGKTKAKTQATARRQALVVAGMHRSGTSAMARLLSLSGATLPERVMDPGPDNPLGYWEPWEMVALDDAILQAVGSRWDNVFSVFDDARAWDRRGEFLDQAKAFLELNFGDQDLLVMKDPRSSILTRFWRQALDEIAVDPVYVIMVRHPLEVAESLKARSGTSRETALMLWTSYMLAVERDTRGKPRVFVSYSDMLNDWRGTLDRVEADLGRTLPDRTPEATAEIERFLSKSHRHHDIAAETLDEPGVWAGASKTYGWMTAAARGTAPATAPLAKVEAELAALEQAVGPLLADLRRELYQIPELKTQLATAREDEARIGFLLEDTRKERDALRAAYDRLHAESDARDQAARGAFAELERSSAAAVAYLEGVGAQWKREAEAERIKVEILRERAAVAESEAEVFRAQLEGSRAETQAVLASTSWKITRPVRAVITRLRRG